MTAVPPERDEQRQVGPPPEPGPPARVRLRRPKRADSRLLDLWRSSALYMGEFNDFGPPLRRRRFAFDVPRGHLIVERSTDGVPVGTVSWHAVSYGPGPESAAWNIGIALIPDGRGFGFGAEAQRLLAAHLFRTTPAHRVEAQTDVENLAEQRALEKAGFVREGVLRGAQYRAGRWHDLVVYSITRDQAAPSPTRA